MGWSTLLAAGAGFDADSFRLVYGEDNIATMNATSPKIELEASAARGDAHSAVTGEQVLGNPEAASHDVGAAVIPEEGIPVFSGDVLLSSALDAPVNELPLAEMVVAPELVVEAEEDMQALLSMMNVRVVVPAN